MFNFILKNRPISYNSRKGSKAKKENYKNVIQAAFRNNYPEHEVLTGDVYATIYYFFNEDLKIDTDNLSKPLLDHLTGFLFVDDRQIRMRVAGSFNLSQGNINQIDLSGLQPEFAESLMEAFENERHVVYIECGIFKHSMYKFNLEQ